MSQARGVKNVVLVHGGFVDGSGWQGVYRRAGSSVVEVKAANSAT